MISIHALREEGDLSRLIGTFLISIFLSTPSARRATLRQSFQFTMQTVFLSTPSARRATGWKWSQWMWVKNFYPRPPRGGRLDAGKQIIMDDLFLSTPSARRATCE